MTRPTVIALLLLGAYFGGGCGVRSWDYNTPPTALDSAESPAAGVAMARRRGLPLIAIAPFDNPKGGSVEWATVGRGMSDALAAAIINEGRFDVQHDATLGKRVAEILRGDPALQTQRLREVREGERETDSDATGAARLRFVILGRVTDFHHTRELPKELTRIGGRNEAIAAIELRVVDLVRGQVVVSDHVYGTAKAGKTGADELYNRVAFGSYLFWSTPLGRASEAALDRAMIRVQQATRSKRDPGPVERIAAAPAALTRTVSTGAKSIIPGGAEQPSLSHSHLHIIRVIGDDFGGREVEIHTPPNQRLTVGREYYLATLRGNGLEPIRDPAMHRPVKVRITSTSSTTARGFLLGLPPRSQSLAGVRLTPTLPGP